MRNAILIPILLLSASAPAGGDEVVTAPVVVRGARVGGEQAGGAERALEEPSFVTVVEIDRHRGETISVAEALAETVGVSVRSLGGLGAFASISMRGAPSGQTEILVDGVPLSRFAFSSVDVGSLDLAGFDRVEIVRGGVPAELGGAVLGGAVNFVTAAGPGEGGARTEVTAGGGSFGARRARVARRDRLGRLATTVALGYQGAEGDFPYFDDNGTPLNRSDDGTRERLDNGFDAFDAAARFAWSGALRASGGARFTFKDQGIPGPTGAQAEHPSLTTSRGLVDGGVRRVIGAGLAVGARGFGLFEAQRFRDPEGEVGLLMADTSFSTGAGGLVLSGDLAPSPHQRLSASLEGTLELLSQIDHRAADPADEEATGRRLGGAAAVADEIVLGTDDQLALIPALRVDLLTTRGAGTGNPVLGGRAPAARDDAYFSPRLSARWRATPALTVKANAGRYFRPPTVIELFGDRGFVAGNPGLAPETGVAGDAGMVLAPAAGFGPVDRLYLEAALFGARVDDLIAFLPTSGRVSRAGNLSDALLGGVETALAARLFRTLELTGNYTFLESEQRSERVAVDGRRLPGRPRHELYLRADVARRLGATRLTLGGFADFTFVSGNFLDEGNLNEVPARRLVGAGVRAAWGTGLSAVVELKNVFDVRVEDARGIPRAVADVLDYPLPGRALYATVDLRF